MIAVYYNNIKEIPLSIFMQIIDGGDTSLLRIKGFFKKKDTNDIWKIIINEFSEMMGVENNHHTIGLIKYISLMNQKISLIEFCIRSLARGYNDDLSKMLNALGVRNKIKEDDLINSLNIALTETKRMRFSVNEKEQELNASHGKSNDSLSDQIENLLLDLSKYQGYKIDQSMTVYQFCILTKKYKDYIKELNKKNNGK